MEARAGDTRNIGIAVSGGGFRATAWGLGAMVGLARALELEAAKQSDECGPASTIVSVSSVSGGSLANAALAMHAGDDLDALTAEQLVADVAPMIRHVAFEGLIRYARATTGSLLRTYALAVLSAFATSALAGMAVATNRDWSSTWLVVGGAILGAVLAIVILLLAHSSPGPERLAFAGAAFAVPFGFGLGAGAVVESAWADVWPWIASVLLIVAVALWTWTFRRLYGRGSLVEHAMAEGPLAGPGTPRVSSLTLESLKHRRVHHVFCGTELQSGDQFFLSPRMAYGFQLGWADSPGSWTLARAVQGSAALPGGFPPQRTVLGALGVRLERWWWVPDTAPADPAKRVVLVDGGVYDNMGTEWEFGFQARVGRLDRDGIENPLAAIQPAADFLIIVNAGKALAWTDIWGGLRLKRELAGLTRDQSIQYDQTTATRRRALVSMFRAAEAGAADLPTGVIVQASSSPLGVAYVVKRDLEISTPEKRQRAEQWIPVLEAMGVNWSEIASSNAGVPTVLSALGPEHTLQLLWHAAVLTQVQLHIHYDIGAVEPIDRQIFADALRDR